MVEKVNELKELSKGIDIQIVDMKKGLSQIFSMLTMLERGCDSESVEALPVMLSVVGKNLNDLVCTKVHKLEEYTVRSNIILNSLCGVEEKPKKTRKPRVKKTSEDTKSADKQIKKPVSKKLEPADVQVVPEVKEDEQNN